MQSRSGVTDVRWVVVLLAVLAVLGVALIAVGVGLWSLPAGLVVGGVEALAGSGLGFAVVGRLQGRRPGGRR